MEKFENISKNFGGKELNDHSINWIPKKTKLMSVYRSNQGIPIKCFGHFSRKPIQCQIRNLSLKKLRYFFCNVISPLGFCVTDPINPTD